jgi:hypothetical protein
MTVRKTLLQVITAGVLMVTGVGFAAGTAVAAGSSSSSTVAVSAASGASDSAGLMSEDDSGWQGTGS